MPEEGRKKNTGEKVQDLGNRMQRVGCLLTLLVSVPIILTIILGIPGLIIGGILAILVMVGYFGGSRTD